MTELNIRYSSRLSMRVYADKQHWSKLLHGTWMEWRRRRRRGRHNWTVFFFFVVYSLLFNLFVKFHLDETEEQGDLKSDCSKSHRRNVLDSNCEQKMLHEQKNAEIVPVASLHFASVNNAIFPIQKNKDQQKKKKQ